MVLKAVGDRSFIFEGFALDGLEDNHLGRAHRESTANLCTELGVDPNRQADHGAESLFPKIAEAMYLGSTYFESRRSFERERGYADRIVEEFIHLAAAGVVGVATQSATWQTAR